MTTNFKDEDIKTAKQAIQVWMKEFPEAATSLKNIWKAHFMLVGHKNLAREFTGKDAE